MEIINQITLIMKMVFIVILLNTIILGGQIELYKIILTEKGYGVVEKHFEREYNNLEIYMNTFGKIDTEDERFMLQKVSNNYDDYKEWSHLLSKYEGWLINE